jgi:regulator of RNase E activity RraA
VLHTIVRFKLQPGAVAVASMRGRVADGVRAGDLLAAAIFRRSGNSFIVDGGVRDRNGLEPEGFPIYIRRTHPSAFGDLVMTVLGTLP